MFKEKIGSDEQYKYWNESVSYWLKYDNEINKKFNNITQTLFSNLSFSNAKYILDVGCGSGYTTKIISDKIKGFGSVLGMDLSAPMLALLNKKYKSIKNISTIHSDVQNYKFKEKSFDIVISRFGLMFFANPQLAFNNLNKSIKKGGILSFVCWTDYQYNDFFSIPVKVLSSVTGLKKNRLTRNPGPFAFSNKNYIYKILQNSNFKKIKIKTIKTKLIAENITKDLNIFMKIGIAAKMMRENNINKITKKKIKLKLNNYLIRNIYNNAGSYKAKVFLVRAIK